MGGFISFYMGVGAEPSQCARPCDSDTDGNWRREEEGKEEREEKRERRKKSRKRSRETNEEDKKKEDEKKSRVAKLLR